MQNIELERLLLEDDPAVGAAKRMKFCLRCAESVEENLESPEALDCLALFRRAVDSSQPWPTSDQAVLQDRTAMLARSHPGSSSVDGARHAAVSATHALAAAVAGRAKDAAAYAAYSQVYGYGGYAVSDPESFVPIHRQQVQWWKDL